jgi:photosystem II stability/assembly factor-like uncharacterized protein
MVRRTRKQIGRVSPGNGACLSKEILAMSSQTRAFWTPAVFLLLLGVPAFAASPPWTPLGPFGGSVETLAVAPADARALYATLGPQGAFRSADGGLTWTAISTGTTTSNVAVDPTRPGTIYLATSPGGLRKSIDGGGHWTPLAIPVTRVQAVAVDPARPSRLYAGTSSQGVWRSTDGGASWQPARVPLPAGRAGEVHALSVPRAGGIVYAGTGAGVFKSTDGALTWKPTGHGPSGVVLALAAAPSDPKTVYASVANGFQEIVFRSKDGGASWQATARPPLPAPQGRVLALAVSPRSPGVVWAGTDPNGLFKTTDGGAHWASAGLPPQGRRVPAVAVAPSSPGTLYVGVTAQGTDLGGVFASADGGASWLRRDQGLSGLDARALAAPPGTPGLLWAGLSGQGLFRSANGGRRWARVVLPGSSPLVNGIPLVDLEIAPSASSTLYALALSWLWRSTDAGASWTEAFAPPTGPRLELLRVDPADPFRLWGSVGTGPLGNLPAQLLRSDDGGETWENAPTPNLGCELFDLAFAPSSPSTLYVAGALADTSTCKITRATVFRSTDDGASWTAADAGLTAPSVTLLAVDPLDPRLVYAGTGGDLYFKGDGVWKSADGGASWARAGGELKGRSITALAVSPVAGVLWAAADGAVFRSGDGGGTWSDRTDGLQAATVYKLALDPADPRRVYAATSGGIWVLEDGEP